MSNIIEKAVEEYLNEITPAEIKKKVASLNANLFCGPQYGSWNDSDIREVTEYVDNIGTLYFCEWSGLIETEIDETDPESYIEVSSGLVAKIICGVNIIPYLKEGDFTHKLM